MWWGRGKKFPSLIRIHSTATRTHEDGGHECHRASERVDGHAAGEVLEADRPVRVVAIGALIEPAVGAPLPVRADRIDERCTMQVSASNYSLFIVYRRAVHSAYSEQDETLKLFRLMTV